MRVFKSKWFNRFARREGIEDDKLKAIVNEVLEADLADADYGGGVYKVRVARPGEGKSGGYRVIVFFRVEDKTLFHYGYPKSIRDNVSEKELKTFKELSKLFLAISEQQLNEAVKSGRLTEI
ncbi:addiction module toxin RelE [Spirochaetia bacterium]|nr:addiction module toxin RelE [Spirochaetia bacterium]